MNRIIFFILFILQHPYILIRKEVPALPYRARWYIILIRLPYFPENPMVLDQLVSEWHAAGIQPGDTVLIHTSLKRTFTRYAEQGHTLTPQIVLDSFRQALGPEGTLLLPLFNFDFTKGVPFDMRTTPSQMGALTEAGRLTPGAVRTGHPIYSFAVLGRQAELFRGVNNFSGYGADSPFAMLRQLDAKIAALNLYDQNSMTFYHHVEEMHNAPYRFHKRFTAPYTGFDGVTGDAPTACSCAISRWARSPTSTRAAS